MTHWTQTGSDRTIAWTPLKPFGDGLGGIDFVPTIENNATWRVSTTKRDRIVIQSRSRISSNQTVEGKP